MIEYDGQYFFMHGKEETVREEEEQIKMIELLTSDFKPLEGFAYSWRWTNPKRILLPEIGLAQLHPLKEEKAQEIWQAQFVYSNELWNYAFDTAMEPITSSSLFEWIRHIDITVEKGDRVEKIHRGQTYLTTFEPQDDQLVIVMWEPTIAVAMSWQVFCMYWEDFCYPGCDDVSIWPLSERWGLVYHHEDQLIFGRPLLPLLDQAARERAWNPPAKPLIHRDEVLRLLRANEKIAAIKFYRQETGVGLKRAKDAVDALLAEMGKDDDS